VSRHEKLRLARRVWASIRSNYWFVPTLIIAGCVGLAYGMLVLDVILPQKLILRLGWVYTRDAAGARALLSVISQSMITVAGVVFSITVVALTLASNQFGTRVLKSFARDTGNQIVLGTFLGTFLYCLLVMRRVESEHQAFVPSISVAVGIFLAMASVAVLVYFIHHVILEIQAENVVSAVTDDLFETIDFVFPETLGKGAYKPQPSPRPSVNLEGMQEVCSQKEGFIRSIDSEKVLQVAVKHEALIQILLLPGAFVTRRTVLARFKLARGSKEKLQEELASCFDIGRHRTYDQDLGFAFDQLALIAVRSMSPAINAVGTAEDAMDWLKAALVRLGEREIPSGYRHDDQNRLRVITPTWDLDALMEEVLDPVRQSAQSNPGFILHTIKALAQAAELCRNPSLRTALEEHIRRFGGTAGGFAQDIDKANIRSTVERLLQDRRAS
jgi:uncharacterized membrane protein